jgi:hypothetical protein
MKLSKIGAPALLVITLAIIVLAAGPLGAQEAVSKAKVLGGWDVEVTAEGQSYYLTMTLTEEEGAFAGTISEQNGMFTDAPMSSLDYDGQTLSFEFNSPTPPDGMTRLLQVSMAWAGDALEGSVTIPDLGMTVPAKAFKKS